MIPKKLRRELFAEWDGRCTYCSRSLPMRKITIDHIIPESRDGRTALENLVICCAHCNQSKRDRTPEEWAADILAACGAAVPTH